MSVKDVYLQGYSRLDFRESPRLLRVLDIVDRRVPKSPMARLLDVGCGDGGFTVALGEKLGSKQLFGVDISPEAVREAAGKGVTAVALDMDHKDVPFESGSFDFIYCGNLIELVLDPDRLLQEIHRLLSPSGTLVMTFPNLGAWASRVAVLLGYHPFYDRISRRYNLGKMFVPAARGDSTGFIRLLTTRSFRELAGLYGFRLRSLHGAPDDSLPRVMRPFDQVFAKFPSLAFQVIAVAQKKGSHGA